MGKGGEEESRMERQSKCEQDKVQEKKKNEGERWGEWDDAPTGFRSLPTLCLPAGERF